MKDRSRRKLNANQIIQELRPKFEQVPGINIYMQSPPLIRVGGMASKGLYQYSLLDTDVKELFDQVPKLMAKLAEQPGIQDVTSDLQIAAPQIIVEIDRDKAATLGVTPQQIENALNDAYGERAVFDHLRRRGGILGGLRSRNRNSSASPTALSNFTSPVRSPGRTTCQN